MKLYYLIISVTFSTLLLASCGDDDVSSGETTNGEPTYTVEDTSVYHYLFCDDWQLWNWVTDTSLLSFRVAKFDIYDNRVGYDVYFRCNDSTHYEDLEEGWPAMYYKRAYYHIIDFSTKKTGICFFIQTSTSEMRQMAN